MHLEKRPFHAAAPVTMLACLLVGSSCVGYRLGSMPPPGVHTVNVPTFVNQCGEPQAEFQTTRAVIQEFQKDGNLKIADAGQADAILRVTLVAYRLQPLRYERDDNRSTQEYRAILTADYKLEEARTGKVISSKRVKGEATFDYRGDLTTSKAQALPQASQDLARNLVASVVDFW